MSGRKTKKRIPAPLDQEIRSPGGNGKPPLSARSPLAGATTVDYKRPLSNGQFWRLIQGDCRDGLV
jgi:hypothetical protein